MMVDTDESETPAFPPQAPGPTPSLLRDKVLQGRSSRAGEWRSAEVNLAGPVCGPVPPEKPQRANVQSLYSPVRCRELGGIFLYNMVT